MTEDVYILIHGQPPHAATILGPPAISEPARMRIASLLAHANKEQPSPLDTGILKAQIAKALEEHPYGH